MPKTLQIRKLMIPFIYNKATLSKSVALFISISLVIDSCT